ncbi:hypothetical protein M9Y10_001744 [Tritrichomonas musculus]|uniref:Serine/threonine-protein phosphatase n=1 Tax=Tritrichomonas musculus TaxID=1915356 RepID=A0ABR2L7W7_9EUKA
MISMPSLSPTTITFEDILEVYKKIIYQSPHEHFDIISKSKSKFRLPIIPIDALNNLIDHCMKIFQEEPSILQLNAPIIVIGDLHGHLFDLFRILKIYDIPSLSDKKYLFLGDIVDRGEFSTETLTLILVLKALYPKNVFIIRGNHEFGEIAGHCGFFSELLSLYNNDDIINNFLKLFSYIPLAASVKASLPLSNNQSSDESKYAFCVHGGIGPSFFIEDQINNLQKPIDTYSDQPLLKDILWSDPTFDSSITEYSESHRGMGHHFGINSINSFLQRNGYSILVRGHQCVSNGFEYHLNYKVITVFSASNYCGDTNNKSAVMTISQGERYCCENFEPLQYIRRIDVALTPFELMRSKRITKHNSNYTNTKSAKLFHLETSIKVSNSSNIFLNQSDLSKETRTTSISNLNKKFVRQMQTTPTKPKNLEISHNRRKSVCTRFYPH